MRLEAFSVMDERIQRVLGHFQKDFEGGVSAENLGTKFGGYGSFLATYERSSAFPFVKSPERYRRTHSSHNSGSITVKPAYDLMKFPNSKLDSQVPVAPVVQNSTVKDENLTRPNNNSSLKFRIKFGSDVKNRAPSNSFIGSGADLDNSPSSSVGCNLGMKDIICKRSIEIFNESPSAILQDMTSFPVPESAPLSPLSESLFCLTEKDICGNEGLEEQKFKEYCGTNRKDEQKQDKFFNGKSISLETVPESNAKVKRFNPAKQYRSNDPGANVLHDDEILYQKVDNKSIVDEMKSDLICSSTGPSNVSQGISENLGGERPVSSKKEERRSSESNFSNFSDEARTSQPRSGEKITTSGALMPKKNRLVQPNNIKEKKMKFGSLSKDYFCSSRLEESVKVDQIAFQLDAGKPFAEENSIRSDECSIKKRKFSSISSFEVDERTSYIIDSKKKIVNFPRNVRNDRDATAILNRRYEPYENLESNLNLSSMPSNSKNNNKSGNEVMRNYNPENMRDPRLIKDKWVMCDSCEKWRLLPHTTNPEKLPDKWLCCMLDWLPGMNSCDISEEETTRALCSLYQISPEVVLTYCQNDKGNSQGLASGCEPNKAGFKEYAEENKKLRTKDLEMVPHDAMTRSVNSVVNRAQVSRKRKNAYNAHHVETDRSNAALSTRKSMLADSSDVCISKKNNRHDLLQDICTLSDNAKDKLADHSKRLKVDFSSTPNFKILAERSTDGNYDSNSRMVVSLKVGAATVSDDVSAELGTTCVDSSGIKLNEHPDKKNSKKGYVIHLRVNGKPANDKECRMIKCNDLQRRVVSPPRGSIAGLVCSSNVSNPLKVEPVDEEVKISPIETLSSSPSRPRDASSEILKEAQNLRDRGDHFRASGFGFESNETYFEAALKFLLGASSLESSITEAFSNGEMKQIEAYRTAAQICECCAIEYEKLNDMATAALAYKCMEVAYWRMVYLRNPASSRDRSELEACVRSIAQGDSPSSSASDVDNLNNQNAVSKVFPTASQLGKPLLPARHNAQILRLLDFTRDAHSAMEASRKTQSALVSAESAAEKGKKKGRLPSVVNAVNCGYQEVDRVVNLVRIAMRDVNR